MLTVTFQWLKLFTLGAVFSYLVLFISPIVRKFWYSSQYFFCRYHYYCLALVLQKFLVHFDITESHFCKYHRISKTTLRCYATVNESGLSKHVAFIIKSTLVFKKKLMPLFLADEHEVNFSGM